MNWILFSNSDLISETHNPYPTEIIESRYSNEVWVRYEKKEDFIYSTKDGSLKSKNLEITKFILHF